MEPIPRQPAGSQRNGGSEFREFVRAVGHFEGSPANVQIQDRTGAPAVPTTNGKESHARFFAARDLLGSHRGLVFRPGRTSAPLVASRIAEVQNASKSLALWRAANSHASKTNSI